MKRSVLVILATTTFATAALGQGKDSILSFEDLFPPEQQKEMGLQKLTNGERDALRAHVVELLTLALASRSGNSAGSYPGVGGGHWIKENIDRGSFILLEDGSLWEIDSLDKVDAMLWLRITDITVVESSTGYLLINTDDGEKAGAKYMGHK